MQSRHIIYSRAVLVARQWLTDFLHVVQYVLHINLNYALHISIPVLSHPYTCSDDLMHVKPFCEVISVSLHMSVITQDGDSPLMMAAKKGRTKVISLLVKAGATLDPSWNKASFVTLMKKLGSKIFIY